MDDRMLKLLMEYAVKDQTYKPNDNVHQRVKDKYADYKIEQQKFEAGPLLCPDMMKRMHIRGVV